MNATSGELKNLLLESLKMQAQLRYAIKVTKLRVDLIGARLNEVQPLAENNRRIWDRTGEDLDKAMIELDTNFDELLSAMERYAKNG